VPYRSRLPLYTWRAMRAVDLIRRKRDGLRLSASEVRAFVAGVTDGSWPDYQVAAMLMAIVLRGMTPDECAVLTGAMVESGVRLSHPQWGDAVVDKHSTGGVGDKVSLVLAPLAAACGAVVPMISGRGLGHTGGTLDKLESIPGVRTRLSVDEIRRSLARIGCVLAGQTDDMAPADRRMYALRDVTATVESVPLISASILSKKIAEGIKGLVIDVKVGSGGFMHTDSEARDLARSLVHIASLNGVRTEAVLTSMDRPLGRAVGNVVEVIEAIETLKGRGPEDTERLSVHLTARMLVLAGVAASHDEAEIRVREALSSGAGVERFRDIVEAQGGDGRVVDDYGRFPAATCQATVTAPATGRLAPLDAGSTGRAAVALGAGRDYVDADVDPSAGIEILLPPGAEVRRGEAVLVVAGCDQARVEAACRLLAAAVTVSDEVPAPVPLIRESLRADSLPVSDV
jgi:pyrimidine-nucleoside phosphorylase